MAYREVMDLGMPAWTPAACTLPTVDRPLRVAEFDRLLATAGRGQQRLSPTLLRWHLAPGAEAAARDLAARESSCCSFFTFTIAAGPDEVRVDVEVPATHTDVLDGLQARVPAG